MSDTLDLDTGYDVSRQQLPQISKKDIPEFLKFLEKHHVPFEQVTKKVFELKPTQDELNKDKIKKFMEQDVEDLNDAPFIISKGDRILDGHHRWAAIKLKDGDFDVDVIRVGLPIDKLISFGNVFSKSFHKSIDEMKLTTILKSIVENL